MLGSLQPFSNKLPSMDRILMVADSHRIMMKVPFDILLYMKGDCSRKDLQVLLPFKLALARVKVDLMVEVAQTTILILQACTLCIGLVQHSRSTQLFSLFCLS